MEFHAKFFEELNLSQLYEILKSRMEVFMLEQRIFCLDMDNVDYRSRHFLLEDGNRVVGYLRAFYQEDDPGIVHMGRVLTLHHGKGLGRALMERSLADIRENMPCRAVRLDSQKHAVGFYEKFGFYAISGEFLEEGIPHVTMEMKMG